MIYATQQEHSPNLKLRLIGVVAALAVLMGVLAFACSGPSGDTDPAAGTVPATSGEGEAILGGSGDGGGTGDGGSGDGGGDGDGGTGETGDGDGGPGDDGGGGPGGDGDDGDEPAAVEPAPEDCVSYDPSNLTVEAVGDLWRLRSGGHLMQMFATQSDANAGLANARNWSRMCFIGRQTERPDRYFYIKTYWQEPSGLPLGPAPATECIEYDAADLAIYGPDPQGYALFSGSIPLLVLDTEPDALRARQVASGFNKLCLIGHGNTQPDPDRYVVEFWRY
jgi:hypothetical protein